LLIWGDPATNETIYEDLAAIENVPWYPPDPTYNAYWTQKYAKRIPLNNLLAQYMKSFGTLDKRLGGPDSAIIIISILNADYKGLSYADPHLLGKTVCSRLHQLLE
jgi:hypothetical protein